MLPTDMALIEDKQFTKYVKIYAKDQDAFFKDFASAFGKLIALGTEGVEVEKTSDESEETKAFREMAMHGNLIRMKDIKGKPDVNAPETYTNRTALHKASYFGHDHVVEYVLNLGGDVTKVDVDGDTPLHDAVRLGHTKCADLLMSNGAKKDVKNKKGETPLSLANALDSDECLAVLNTSRSNSGNILSC